MDKLNVIPVATIIVVIFAIVGGVVVVNDELAFKDYLEAMVIAVGALAVGRGLDNHPKG